MKGALKIFAILSPIALLVLYISIIQTKQTNINYKIQSQKFEIDKHNFNEEFHNFLNPQAQNKPDNYTVTIKKKIAQEKKKLKELEERQEKVMNEVSNAAN